MLVKCSHSDLSRIQKFDDLSDDIHAMLDHTSSGGLLIEQRNESALCWRVFYGRLHRGMVGSPCNDISTGEFFCL